MFDPYANMPRINRGMVYLGACLIAGIRLARKKQMNHRVIPSQAIDESIDLAYEMFTRVFSRSAKKAYQQDSRELSIMHLKSHRFLLIVGVIL